VKPLRALVIALLIAAIGSTAAIAMLRARTPALPRLGEVPAFTLTGADGQPFGTRDLDGRPWVVDFVFTSCPSVCPRMTEQMAQLQTWLRNRALDGRVHLVSISVDPTTDTPAVLRAYADRFGARPSTWTFVTGPQQAIEDAVVRGFKIAVSREKLDPSGGVGDQERGDSNDSQDGFAIVHGTKFVLVDKARQIRGYYDSNDAASQAALRRDVEALAHGNE
jgi:protein SCO1/2